MAKGLFKSLVVRLVQLGNFDHPDFEEIDKLGAQNGVDAETARKAFFVARDVQSLVEGERLEGGSGEISQRVDPEAILKSTFSKGEKKL